MEREPDKPEEFVVYECSDLRISSVGEELERLRQEEMEEAKVSGTVEHGDSFGDFLGTP